MPKLDCHRRDCTKIRSEFSLFLSRRRAPRFDGCTFCSHACLEKYLEGELTDKWQRLLRDRTRRIPRPRLGTILLQESLVTAEQLDEAVTMQRQSQQGRLGEWLQRLGFVEERHITMALAKQYGLPTINLRNFSPKSASARLIPATVAKCFCLIPVGFDDQQKSLQIAASGPVNFGSQEAIRRMTRSGVLTFIADQSAVENLIAQWYEPEELDLSSVPTYSTLDDLLEITRKLLSTAANQRADNIQAELLDDFFWARIDSGSTSSHLFCRHSPSPLHEAVSVQAHRYLAASVSAG